MWVTRGGSRVWVQRRPNPRVRRQWWFLKNELSHENETICADRRVDLDPADFWGELAGVIPGPGVIGPGSNQDHVPPVEHGPKISGPGSHLLSHLLTGGKAVLEF